MWSRFDPNNYWPLVKPSFADDVQIASFGHMRRGGQAVWFDGKDTPISSNEVFSYAMAAVKSPLAAEETTYEQLVMDFGVRRFCARASLLGGLSLVYRRMIPVAQKLITEELEYFPEDPEKIYKHVSTFCADFLSKALFECFTTCYDRNILAMWVTILVPGGWGISINNPTAESLAKLPVSAFKSMTWNPEMIVRLKSMNTQEDIRSIGIMYKREAIAVADKLMAALNYKFNF